MQEYLKFAVRGSGARARILAIRVKRVKACYSLA